MCMKMAALRRMCIFADEDFSYFGGIDIVELTHSSKENSVPVRVSHVRKAMRRKADIILRNDAKRCFLRKDAKVKSRIAH